MLYPVYAGTYERNTGQTIPWPDMTRPYRDWVIQIVHFIFDLKLGQKPLYSLLGSPEDR